MTAPKISGKPDTEWRHILGMLGIQNLENLRNTVGHIILTVFEEEIVSRLVLAHENLLQEREKAHDDWVTEADLASEDRLLNALQELDIKVGFLGEESLESNPDALRTLQTGLCWVVDPLDGTALFRQTRAGFGCHVALCDDGVPIAGWTAIWDGARTHLMSAIRGHGVVWDGEVLTPADVTPHGNGAGSVGKKWFRQDWPWSSWDEEASITSIGSAMDWTQLVLHAAGHHQGRHGPSWFIQAHDKPWDHLAGVLFLQEMGGQTIRLDGSPWNALDSGKGIVSGTVAARAGIDISEILERFTHHASHDDLAHAADTIYRVHAPEQQPAASP